MRENKPTLDDYKWLRENELYRFTHNNQVAGYTPAMVAHVLAGGLAGTGIGAISGKLSHKGAGKGAKWGSVIGAGVGLGAGILKYHLRKSELKKLNKMTPDQRTRYYEYRYRKLYGS